MAGKISELDEAQALADADLIELSQLIGIDLFSRKANLADVFAYIKSKSKGFSAPVIDGIAGAAISGHRVVFIDSANTVQYASSDSESAYVALGLTTGAASAGSSIQVQLMGRITEQSWNWTPEREVYLGANGFVTQAPPVSGACIELGIADTSTSIFIRVQQAVGLG